MATILIIEDNPQNMYLSTYILTKNNHTVLQAVDGYKGIDMAEREKPDLVLLDIQLPGIDGYAIAAKLKGNPITRHIPIVAVTSFAMAGDREHILASGCEGYIEKPIDPDTFMGEITTHLKTG